MRIGILSFQQNYHDRPEHYVSKTFAALMCAEKRYGERTRTVLFTAIWVPGRKDVVKLQTDEPFKLIKERLKKAKLAVIPIPSLLPPLVNYGCAVAPYPCPDHSSYAKRDFKLLWGCSQEEWMRRVGLDDREI